MPKDTPQSRAPRLLEQLRDEIRFRHYSIRTEQAYLGWVKRFILFHGKRHPRDMGAEEVTRFLTHLAVQGNVAASTQNQALNAILFLYREVLKIELAWLDDIHRAKKPARLPVVLTRDEVRTRLAQFDGTQWLIAAPGCGCWRPRAFASRTSTFTTSSSLSGMPRGRKTA